ncbi:DUF1963 domain-containing protein [Actinoplanes sp. L3-i22]|uniref:DUF1963 domain-containing protein n=1 Tax=Actinoplanes sp. L3-i22 TaxID=2836373 RepID=UPI001C791A34|nr:DUF1963 domain-containing protein [Actinoplanes sp. L3-i22]BCY11710.1 hypothetical protein L3i22_067980 [Actinoplanes sp. L3-i22]
MDFHEQFRQTATESGVPAAESARFAGLLRFRIRAGGTPGGARAGRFGGLPHLPAGTPWPSGLAYLASADCAALPRIAGLALPETGSLLFFLAAAAAVEACSIESEQSLAKVVHVPAGAATTAVAAPDDLPPPLPERDLFARVEADLPDWPDRPAAWWTDDQKQLMADLPHYAELCALVERTWPGRVPWIGDDLVLGGYSVSAQDSPEEQLAARDPAADEARMMREWVPLAQFAVPRQDYIHGRFLIRHDDLAAARFDQALSFCEFTE